MGGGGRLEITQLKLLIGATAGWVCYSETKQGQQSNPMKHVALQTGAAIGGHCRRSRGRQQPSLLLSIVPATKQGQYAGRSSS